MSLLEVAGLTVAFDGAASARPVVEGLDLDVAPGEVVGLVGESGSGKSVTALALLRLLGPSARVQGSVRLEGRELLALGEEEIREVRGREIAMIFQEPMTSLNPVFRVGFQVAEAFEAHGLASRREARARAVELLDLVGIPDPAERARAYPHELSGGMRQRVMIAMAMAARPKLLIADEPTTALDVTIQAQILELMRELEARFGTSILLVSHDMGVVASMADRVLVLYAGQLVEEGPVERVLRAPRHPYTRLLLRSVPRLDRKLERLESIPGRSPSPSELPSGCRFHPRCPVAIGRCARDAPQLLGGAGDRSRCFLDGEAPAP